MRGFFCRSAPRNYDRVWLSMGSLLEVTGSSDLSLGKKLAMMDPCDEHQKRLLSARARSGLSLVLRKWVNDVLC